MIYLVDGHNVIGHLGDIDLSDPEDEMQLIERLRSWAAAGRKRKVIVFFDGGLVGGEARGLSRGPVRVIFASASSSADALLLAHIDRARNPVEYTVVTSDREILARARARRMPHWKAPEFIARLPRAPGRRPAAARDQDRPQAAAPTQKERPRLDEAEVAQWLELFGPERESTPPPRPERPAPRPAPSATEEPSPREPRQAKRSEEMLSPEEVAEWLRLFEQEES